MCALFPHPHHHHPGPAPPAIDSLELRPRRILRRVQRQMPVGRVQELDRKTMLVLARLPGDTLAEKAGDCQRLSAVAREENFDTLENRVLRAYCELAHRAARQYLDRNRTRRQTSRARRVESYGKRCSRLARSLAENGVRLAEAGVSPNFVLQQNALYHKVWDAWSELRQQQKALDEVWRWQARSWEEFCALTLIVALMSVDDAEIVASSPLWFRDEHRRGHWIEADNPLAVVHLRQQRLIAEVRRNSGGASFGGLGAPLWLRIGRAGETQGFHKSVIVWPMWGPKGGLVPNEASEIDTILRTKADVKVARGLVVRPAIHISQLDRDSFGKGLCLALGTEGAALRDCLSAMTEMITQSLGADS